MDSAQWLQPTELSCTTHGNYRQTVATVGQFLQSKVVISSLKLTLVCHLCGLGLSFGCSWTMHLQRDKKEVCNINWNGQMCNFPACGCAAHATRENTNVVTTSMFTALYLLMLEHRALTMLPTPDIPVDGALCRLVWKSNCQATPDM